jgi:hypothetical protein
VERIAAVLRARPDALSPETLRRIAACVSRPWRDANETN